MRVSLTPRHSQLASIAMSPVGKAVCNHGRDLSVGVAWRAGCARGKSRFVLQVAQQGEGVTAVGLTGLNWVELGRTELG